MRKLFLILVASIISISAFTQNNPAEKNAKKTLDKWMEVCNLDSKTQVALYEVLLEKQEAMIKAKDVHGKGTEALKQAKKQIGKEFSPRIKEVVGDECAKKMNEYWKSQK